MTRYEEIIKTVMDLWPRHPDLSPRTRREDAMLQIIAAVAGAESERMMRIIEEGVCPVPERIRFLKQQVTMLQKANTSEVNRRRELETAAQYVIDNIEGYEGIKDRLQAVIDKETTKP